MSVIRLLALKEIRLLLRDRLAAVMLLGMPLLFILVLGLLLGETFGEKPDNSLRVAVVVEDEGPCGVEGQKTWADVLLKDLADTGKDLSESGQGAIRVELIPSRAEAEQLIRDHRRPAVLVLKRGFSARVSRCSFMADGINPFHRDGVFLDKVDAELLRDDTQPVAAGIIDQVTQVSLMRVLLPWMIGGAFDRLKDPDFVEKLGQEVQLPTPKAMRELKNLPPLVRASLPFKIPEPDKGRWWQPPGSRVSLGYLLELAAEQDPVKVQEFRKKVGFGIQRALADQFKNYNLTGKTWEDLVRDRRRAEGAVDEFRNRDGSGLLNRGAQRYQTLVPAFTVMFAFFLVLNVGWVFVGERTQGTLKRLRAAPITRGQVLLGKLVPYFVLSLGQGAFLLVAGRLLFGMRWGPDRWSFAEQAAALVPVVLATSLAAMGLALLVAALSRTELQVTLYGAIPVLVLALVGGCVLPREMMPESAQRFSLVTPQAWALEAYRELLGGGPNYTPNMDIVYWSCGVLTAFAAGFTALAWWLLRLD